MTSAPTAPAVRRVPVGVVLGIAVAWAVAIAVSAAGHSDLLHHDVLARGHDAAVEHPHAHGDRGLPLPAAVAVVVVGWQVMVAAMMLPSTVPLLRLFAHTSARQERPHAALGAFVAGYAVVWAVFGAIAVAGDVALHRLVDGRPGVEERLIPGVVLLLAGAFQFTELKDRCLQQCRHPALWMLRHYRRGVASALDLGRRHGVFCLGCCWALMLLMFAVGVANLLWMAALAALMAYEKIGRHGERVARWAGVGLVVWGIGVLADAAWLPAWSSAAAARGRRCGTGRTRRPNDAHLVDGVERAPGHSTDRLHGRGHARLHGGSVRKTEERSDAWVTRPTGVVRRPAPHGGAGVHPTPHRALCVV